MWRGSLSECCLFARFAGHYPVSAVDLPTRRGALDLARTQDFNRSVKVSSERVMARAGDGSMGMLRWEPGRALRCQSARVALVDEQRCFRLSGKFQLWY